MASLHRAGARGGMITLLGQGGKITIHIAGLVALSRLLAPEDFGLIAMVAVFMTLADLLRDFGLPSAALQVKELSNQQASNLFWASAGLAILSAGLLVACTPLVVAIYDEPRLAAIVPALAAAVVVNGVQAQIQVQLARRMRFGVLALGQVLAPALGLAAAVSAALSAWGYWALVLQPVAAAVALLAIQSLALRWLPALPRRRHGTAALLRSGGQLGATYFLTWAANNADSLVTGARWGATTLGYYSRGFQLTATLVGSLLAPLTQVALPTLNAALKEGRRSSDLLLRVQFLIAAPVTLAMTVIALTAPSLVPLVLGDEWMPAVPIVQILAAGECVHALSIVSYWGFLVENQSKQLLFYNLVTKPIAVGFVLLGSLFGVEGVAAGYVLGLAVSWPINLIWLSRTAGYSARHFLARGIRVLAGGVGAFGLGFLMLDAWLAEQSWAAVAMASVTVLATFLAWHLVFPEGRRDLRRLTRMFEAIR